MGASIIRYLKVRDPLPNPLMASLWIWAGHKRVLEWMIKHIKWGLILNLLMSAFLVASLKSSEYFFMSQVSLDRCGLVQSSDIFGLISGR